MVPNLGIFIISRYFAIAQFQGADTKYNNSFFLILAQKHPNKAFLVPNLGIFVFPQNFAIRQMISKMTLVFLKFSPKNTQIRDFGSKYENKAFLVKNTPK